MRGQIDDEHKQFLPLNLVDDSKLIAEPRRTVTLPVATQGLVVKAAYLSKPGWSGKLNDVLPLFITLEHSLRNLAYPSLKIAMLKDLPHIPNSIYTLNSMSIRERTQRSVTSKL